MKSLDLLAVALTLFGAGQPRAGLDFPHDRETLAGDPCTPIGRPFRKTPNGSSHASFDQLAEIVDAARSFQGGSEEEFRNHLYAPDMHDPDLLIRTSGEQRISNYLLWQCAYSELVFRDELWPDFDRAALEECLREFEARRRRFGART